MHARAPSHLAFLLLALTAVACDAPIVGEWRSDKKLPNEQRNSLTVDSDFVGEATIYATPSYDHSLWAKLKFDFEGEEADDGYRWDLSMECTSSSTGACANDDFQMECKVFDGDDNDGLDKLNCKGDGKWANYPFDWERVED